VKKGDLVRIIKCIPLPMLLDEDIGKVGVVTHEPKGGWTIILVEGRFQAHAIQNLETLNAQD